MAPVFFAGQNSRLFQLASHISMTLRLSLMFKEVHDKIGSEVSDARWREPVPYDKLPSMDDRQAFMAAIARHDLCTGQGVPNPPKTRIKRPRTRAEKPSELQPRRSRHSHETAAHASACSSPVLSISSARRWASRA